MSQQRGGVRTHALKATFPQVLPRIVDYLGNVLPYAMIGLLVVETSILLPEAMASPKQSPSQ